MWDWAYINGQPFLNKDISFSDANLKPKPIVVNLIDINDKDDNKDDNNNSDAASSKLSYESKT
jgi:hypothetical protein